MTVHAAILSAEFPAPFTLPRWQLSRPARLYYALKSAKLELSEDAITDNGATSGGGALENYGTTKIAGCTFAGNRAGGNGNGDGGAVYNDPNAMLTAVNSTFVGNAAEVSGGAISNFGQASLVNVTITNNTANSAAIFSGIHGGGIDTEAGADTLLQNSIVAGNFADGPDDVLGTLNAASSYNLVGVDANGNLVITNGAQHNQVGTVASPINPLLGTLENNGGPTQTCALLAGSLALGAGTFNLTPAPPSLDQRGIARTGANPDLGAFQSQILFTAQLPDVTMKAGTQQTVTFRFSANGLSNVTVAATVDNPTLFPSLALNASAGSILLNPVGAGFADIDVTITGGGDTVSDVFGVRVTALAATTYTGGHRGRSGLQPEPFIAASGNRAGGCGQYGRHNRHPGESARRGRGERDVRAVRATAHHHRQHDHPGPGCG